MSSSDHARADYLSKVQTSGGTPAEHLDPENPAPELRFGSVVQSAMLEIAEETDFDWTTNLDRFTAKVLFLRGELNEAAHLEHQTELAEEYPNYELITIPNVGHEMVWERPEEYLEHARAYLEELDLVGGAS